MICQSSEAICPNKNKADIFISFKTDIENQKHTIFHAVVCLDCFIDSGYLLRSGQIEIIKARKIQKGDKFGVEKEENCFI